MPRSSVTPKLSSTVPMSPPSSGVLGPSQAQAKRTSTACLICTLSRYLPRARASTADEMVGHRSEIDEPCDVGADAEHVPRLHVLTVKHVPFGREMEDSLGVTHVVFVAPYFLQNTLRYIEAFASLEGARVSVIS